MAMDPIESFIHFGQTLSYRDVPPETVKSIKNLMVDYFGVMIGGTASRQARSCADLARRWSGSPEATVFSGGGKVPMHMAVFANSTAGRTLDYDDVHEQAHLHATVAVVPPALAVSEISRVSGEEFIVSVILGFELLARMGLALKKGPGATGMSTTYQGASLAAALVGARLFGFDRERMHNALGIAYSQLAGNQQVIREGVDLMVIQQGISGMSGMMAVEMARNGLTGPKEIFTGRYGYFPVYHPGRYDIDILTKDLGKAWEIKNTSIKPFPCCKLINTAIQAALDLRAENALSPTDIAEVRVGINTEDYDMVCEPVEKKRQPKTVVDAIYSMPYVVAAALIHGKIGLADFTQEAVQRREVLEFSKMVQPVKDVNLPKATDKGIPAWVSITLRNGRTLDCRREAVKGSPSIPLSEEERIGKFNDCLSYAKCPPERGETILKSLENLESMKDVSVLAALCQQGG
jgi:2-methylcitrate dehydratase PrpD